MNILHHRGCLFKVAGDLYPGRFDSPISYAFSVFRYGFIDATTGDPIKSDFFSVSDDYEDGFSFGLSTIVTETF